MLLIPAWGKSQPAYMGEARWVISSLNRQPETLPVTEKKYRMTKNVYLNNAKVISHLKIDPGTRLINNGPTIPATETLRFTGKKLTDPIAFDAPPLQTRDNAEFNISYTDKQHGFAGTNTTAFAEDNNHHIWIASDNGLYRYDGYHYYLYSPKNGVPTMPNCSLLYDNQHRLWMGSDAGVYYIQHDSIFSLQTEDLDFNKMPCFRVQSDYLNNIWFSTKKNGAICMNGSTIQIYDKRCGLPNNYTNAVHLTKGGDIYIGMRESGMVVISKDKMRWLFSDSKNMNTHTILSFYEDEDGIWAGDFLGGLLRMGKKDTVQYSITGNYRERIFDIKEAPGGGLWIAAYSSALCYFNKKDLVIINETNGLLNRFPYTLFEDSFHNLWVSNLQSGFSRINENSFYVQPYQNPAIGMVRRWLPDTKKGTWIVTEGKTLLYQKGKEIFSFNHKDKNNLEPFLYPLDGILNDDGTLWTGSYGPGIVHVNGMENTVYFYTNYPDNSIVNFVEKDAKDNIWFCPFNFGLIRYNHSSFLHYTQKTGLLSDTVLKIFPDESKRIYWTFENGVQRLTNETIETLHIGNQLFSGQVNALLSIDKQTTLLGTNENGLLVINNNKAYQFTKKDGLSSNKIKTIIRDASGKTWITTDKSIESFFLAGNKISELNVYNQANGSFITEVENAFLDSAGIPFWSFGNKKLVYNPDFLYQQNKRPVFRFGQFFTDNKPIIPGNAIEILPDQTITINFTAIFWGRENNLAIKYLLISNRGDTSYYSPGEKGHITIREIPPGNYHFFLSAKDNNHNYYSSPIEINVNNFWYNTWPFRISMVLILLAGIVYYFKQKAKRQITINNLLESRVTEQTQIILQEKTELLKSYQVIDSQNREKDVLIQEINHRVKNNLQFIAAMIEMQMNTDAQKDASQSLKNTARRLAAMSLVHEMLYDKRNSQVLSTKKYIAELVHNLEEMAIDHANPVKFSIDVEDILINSKSAIALGMIISELVSNSLKHAFKTTASPLLTIILQSVSESGNIRLVVSDNGSGTTGEYQSKKSLGSRLVDIFSRQLDGTYTIDYTGRFIFILDFKPTDT
jgi:two-component sensor histidine kinase/ligand-binding sensor domain-containing protein